jgi:outer membrane protein TolC
MTSHEPTPEFRSHLEWQIETAMRRESRLAEPVTGSAPTGWLRTAVVVLVALAIGGAAGIASERVQDAKTRNQLLESAKAEQALLKSRYDLALTDLHEARRRFEVGAAPREEVAEAQRRANGAELALARLVIDMEEIEKTSTPPRDEISAPKVGDSDYVMRRLQLDLKAAQQDFSAATEAVAKAKERFEVGLITNAALVQADMEMAVARTRLQQLQMRAELRQKYLNEQLSAEKLVESVRRAELTLEADLARRQLAFARERLKSLQAMVEIGTLSQLELKRAEVEVLELQLTFQKIQQRLAAMGKKE